MSQPLEPFDVSILRGDQNNLWISVVCRLGTIHAVSTPTPTWPPHLDDFDPGSWLGEQVRYAAPASQDGLAIGKALSAVIFGTDEIARLFDRTRGLAAAEQARVLLRLTTAPAEVAAWPWELMSDPEAPTEYLCLERGVHLVRSARTRTYPVNEQPIKAPLHMLMVLSSPIRETSETFEAAFDLYEEKRSLLRELQPLVAKGLLEVTVEDRPSIERLRRRMNSSQRGFHILHYLGHARPNALELELRNGRRAIVPGEEFATLIGQLPDLRLAVFAGCETAMPPDERDGDGSAVDWTHRMSTADWTVRIAAPAVVGMQSVLPFTTERILTRTFYQGLTAGKSISEALRLARWAIHDDERNRRKGLDWAVPQLVISGAVPGPILDPSAKASPPERPRRAILRLGAEQSDRRFFARLDALRTGIDTLARQGDARVLVVAGRPGVGKTRLLDRILDDLDPSTAQLSMSAGDLVEAVDPLRDLNDFVARVLKAAGDRPPSRGRLSSSAYWNELVEAMIVRPFVLVIDDAHLLGPDHAVTGALVRLARRRGLCRVGVGVTGDTWTPAAALSPGLVRRITLQSLSWTDIWQWIRRNLPALAAHGERRLRPYFSDLGAELEHWEDLAHRLEQISKDSDEDLRRVVDGMDKKRVHLSPPSTQPPPASVSGTTVPILGRQPEGIGQTEQTTAGVAITAVGTVGTTPSYEPTQQLSALRVAIAGEHTAGKSTQFARYVTGFAADHMVAGRATASDVSDAGAAIARLDTIETPFTDGRATAADILRWMQTVNSTELADIMVLDFGTPRQSRPLAELTAAYASSGILMIAAAGKDAGRVFPAWDPHVLAVGALYPNELPKKLVKRSPYDDEQHKPDVFAPGRLSETALAGLLDAEKTTTNGKAEEKGTSFAAMHVAAVAVLVWSTYRGLSAAHVSALLKGRLPLTNPTDSGVSAARPSSWDLDVHAVLLETRAQLIVDTLQTGPLSTSEILAATGLASGVALEAIDRLVETERLETGAESEPKYEDAHALYRLYERARLTAPSSNERTGLLEALVNRAREVFARRRIGAFEVASTWQREQDGPRILAIAAMQELPATRLLAPTLDAIGNSRSAFEQFHALTLAKMMLDDGTLLADDRDVLKDVIELQIAKGHLQEVTTNRRALAEVLLSELG